MVNNALFLTSLPFLYAHTLPFPVSSLPFSIFYLYSAQSLLQKTEGCKHTVSEEWRTERAGKQENRESERTGNRECRRAALPVLLLSWSL
jgi:hypothetical protein